MKGFHCILYMFLCFRIKVVESVVGFVQDTDVVTDVAESYRTMIIEEERYY